MTVTAVIVKSFIVESELSTVSTALALERSIDGDLYAENLSRFGSI